jgi:hypothetical protein
MAKIIRISIAGIQSTGKSYLIGGIKSVFNGSGIMDNLGYKLLNNVNFPYFDSIHQIEQDIKNSATILGTTEYHPYLGEIIDSSKQTKVYLMIANIPGEMYDAFYNIPDNFVGYHNAFEELIQQSRMARKLLQKINSITVKPTWLSWLTKDNLNNLKTNENQLWELFKAHLANRFQYIYANEVDRVTSKIEKYFSAYVFSYLANQTYLCIDPKPNSALKVAQQNNLITSFCNNIVTNRNSTSDLNFVITKFDSLFNNPNKYYLPAKMTCKEDYFNHTEKYISIIADILDGRNISKNNFDVDKLTYYINLISTSNKFKTVKIDNVTLPKNLFLASVTNINQENERIPAKLDLNTYQLQRFPIGCYEMVYSMLLKTGTIQFSQLGLDDFVDKNYKFINAYLN